MADKSRETRAARTYIACALLGFALISIGMVTYAFGISRAFYLALGGVAVLAVGSILTSGSRPTLRRDDWARTAEAAGLAPKPGILLWRVIMALGWLALASMVVAIFVR